MVQAFLKKWGVESDFKAPNLTLSLRHKCSGIQRKIIICHNLFKPLGILAPTDYYIFWLSNILTSSVPDVVRNKLDIYVMFIIRKNVLFQNVLKPNLRELWLCVSENDILSNCLLFLLLYVYYCVYIFIKKRKSGLNDKIDLEAMNKPESYANWARHFLI